LDRTVEEARAAIAGAPQRVGGIADDLAVTPTRSSPEITGDLVKLCDHSVRRTEVALLGSDEQADLLVHGLADDLVQVFRPALSSLGGIVIEIAEALCQVRGGSENHPLVRCQAAAPSGS